MTKASVEPKFLVTRGEGALVLGVSTQFIDNLVAGGYVPAAVDHKHDLGALVRGAIRYLREERRNKKSETAENRVREARAAEIELRTAERSRQVVTVDEAREWISEVVSLFRSGLAGLPARITRDVEDREKIEGHCDGIIEAIRERLVEDRDLEAKPASGAHDSAARANTDASA